MSTIHFSASKNRFFTIIFLFAAPFLLWSFVFQTARNLYSESSATFVVNSSLDTVDNDVGDGICQDAAGNCTLRAAISQANATSQEDTIILAAGTYQLTLVGANENSNISGDLDVLWPVRILGQGAGQTIIQAGTQRDDGIDRVFHVQGVTSVLTLEGVTVRYGRTPNAATNHEGGAIRNASGSLVIIDSVICCSRTGDGTSGGNGGNGGGISSLQGSVTLSNTILYGNLTGRGGDRSDGTGKAGFGGNGGGLYTNETAVSILHSQIYENETGDGGTGSNRSDGGDSGFGGGLSVFFGNNQIFGSAVFNNKTGNGGAATGGGFGGFSGDGGGLHLHGPSVVSNTVVYSNTVGSGGAVIGDGAGIDINYHESVHIVNSTISGNFGARFGGGIQSKLAPLTIRNSTISGNRAGNGGGIYLATGGITVENSIITQSSPNDCISSVTDGITGQNNLVDNYLSGACSGIASSAVSFFDANLQDNGGNTLTHALLPGSNAVDTGTNNCPDQNGTPLLIDQRGAPRPEGPNCDVGAYEKENLAPVAVTDTYTTSEDIALVIIAPGVLANDSDPENSQLTASLQQQSGTGEVALEMDGSFTYTPDPDWNGEDFFIYAASDSQLTSTAMVQISVSPVNDPPEAEDDVDFTDINTDVTTAVLLNDTDIDGNLLPGSLSVITQPVTGTTAVDPVLGTITYTPGVDFLGMDAYTYEICDDGTPAPAACSEAMVTITVLPPNIPPNVSAGEDQYISEGSLVLFEGWYEDPDDDIPGYPIGVTILWDFGDGNSAEGTITPTHVFQDNGVYTVTLTVTDARGGATSDSLVATVSNVAPTVEVSGDLQGITAVSVSFSGSFSDPGSDSHTILWLFGDGSSVENTLTPTHTYQIPGTYTVTLRVTDDDGGIGEGSLVIIVQTKIYLPAVLKNHN